MDGSAPRQPRRFACQEQGPESGAEEERGKTKGLGLIFSGGEKAVTIADEASGSVNRPRSQHSFDQPERKRLGGLDTPIFGRAPQHILERDGKTLAGDFRNPRPEL